MAGLIGTDRILSVADQMEWKTFSIALNLGSE